MQCLHGRTQALVPFGAPAFERRKSNCSKTCSHSNRHLHLQQWSPAQFTLARPKHCSKARWRRKVESCAVDSNGSSQPLRVMISGPPAAGKGTQCERIVKKFGLIHISAGDLLRAEVDSGTEAGKIAAGYMNNGQLVPNHVVVSMVKNRLAQSDAQNQGWLLDGYPRSADQAAAILEEGIHPDVFLLIQVPDEDLIERVVGRRMDPETGQIYHLTFKPPPKDTLKRLIQRSDDTEEKARARLEVHAGNVTSVLDYYKDILVEIDGSQDIAAVGAAIEDVLDTVQNSSSVQQCQEELQADTA